MRAAARSSHIAMRLKNILELVETNGSRISIVQLFKKSYKNLSSVLHHLISHGCPGTARNTLIYGILVSLNLIEIVKSDLKCTGGLRYTNTVFRSSLRREI